MKRPFMIWLLTIMMVCFFVCPAGVSAVGTYGTADTTDTETDSWQSSYGVDTSWFNYLEPKPQYTISTEAELRGLASLVNEEQFLWKPNRNESFEDVTFVLTRDITLTDVWTPIGVDEQITFAGTFDGKGHSITGLALNSEDPNCGFFGHLSGTVRNLTVEGSVSTTEDYAGGIAGYVSDTGKISGCTSNVRVAGRNDVGGITGYCKGGSISESINYGEIIGASMVGGVVGESRGGVVKKCGNRGLVYSNGAGSFNNGTGGVAGQSVSASAIQLCYNVGDVISSNEATGGVVGYTNSSGSSITNSYSTGSIRIEKPQVQTAAAFNPADVTGGAQSSLLAGKSLPVYAGGIAGFVGSQSVVIENCYNAGSITGATYAGGIIGKCQNEMISSAPAAFRNNYYGKGDFDSAIAADRDNKRMKVRGAASEIYDSAFSHLSSSLSSYYMDDKAGEYGSQGYPVLTWQEPVQSEDDLAILKNIDPNVVQWLHDANLALDAEEFRIGHMFLEFFDTELVYENMLDQKKPDGKGTAK